MPTLEEYIRKRKREDRIDEFNVEERVTNMGRCINYVVEYFDKYVDPDKRNIDYEKRKAKCKKYKKQLRNYPQDIIEWLTSIYMKYETRLDVRVRNILKKDPLYFLYYTDDDFLKLTDIFLSKNESKFPLIKGNEKLITKLFKSQINMRNKKAYSIQEYHKLGNKINKWLWETYDQYGISITLFATIYRENFYDATHEYVYDKEKGKAYLKEYYDYKNSNNLFAIDELYEQIKDRPFIKDRKLELEILFMHIWIEDINGEEKYWDIYLSESQKKYALVHS
ncbi:MAG: hypothetical protein ACOCRK_03300 [bacterium]